MLSKILNAVVNSWPFLNACMSFHPSFVEMASNLGSLNDLPEPATFMEVNTNKTYSCLICGLICVVVTVSGTAIIQGCVKYALIAVNAVYLPT